MIAVIRGFVKFNLERFPFFRFIGHELSTSFSGNDKENYTSNDEQTKERFNPAQKLCKTFKMLLTLPLLPQEQH